jgi:hypothetical protein
MMTAAIGLMAFVPATPALAVPTTPASYVQLICGAFHGTFWKYGNAWGCIRQCHKDKTKVCGWFCADNQGCIYIDARGSKRTVRDIADVRRRLRTE